MEPLQDAFDTNGHSVARLRRLVQAAKHQGFQIRQEPLGQQAGTWCEIGGRATIFLDVTQSAADQLAVLQQALDEYRPRATSQIPLGSS